MCSGVLWPLTISPPMSMLVRKPTAPSWRGHGTEGGSRSDAGLLTDSVAPGNSWRGSSWAARVGCLIATGLAPQLLLPPYRMRIRLAALPRPRQWQYSDIRYRLYR